MIVNYRTPELAKRCIDALLAEPNAGCDLDVTLVDGHSDDGSTRDLEKFCEQRAAQGVRFLALEQNGGFGWANNQALMRLLDREAPPEFVYLLNPDAIVQQGALERLIELMRKEQTCAAVGSLLLDEAGQPLGSAFRFPSLRLEFVRGSRTPRLGKWLGVGNGLITANDAVPCDWATGASFLLRAEALRHAGAFDDGFFLYFEDVELMWRLRRAGWTVWHEPASRVIHVGGASTGLNSFCAAGNKSPRRPAYWYRARSRYFALTRGRAVAAFATLAWLGGTILWSIRKILGIAGNQQEVRGEFVDMLRHGILVPGSAAQPSVPRHIAMVGRDPAWKSNGE